MSFTKRQSSLQHMHARLGLGLLVALTLIFGVFYLYNGSSTPSHSDLPSDPIRSTHPGVDAPEGSGELRSPSQSGKATATGAVTVLVDTGAGRVCLVVGLGLEALAGLWIRRILRSAG